MSTPSFIVVLPSSASHHQTWRIRNASRISSQPIIQTATATTQPPILTTSHNRCLTISHQTRWYANLPFHRDPAPWEPSDPPSSSLAWKDRVALYAQFSPSATLSVLLDALRIGGRDDAGIEALYAFANVDVWQVAHRFFGRAMDLGQFERFKRVIAAPPYDMLLRHEDRETLAALTITSDTFVARVRFIAPRREPVVLTFRMTRTNLGMHSSWMVDSILHERPTNGHTTPAHGDRPRSTA